MILYPLVMTNIAFEHGPCIDDLLIKHVIFHSYVQLPEGITFASRVDNCFLVGRSKQTSLPSATLQQFTFMWKIRAERYTVV